MLSEGSKRAVAVLIQYKCGKKQLRHHLADRFTSFITATTPGILTTSGKQSAMTPDIVEDLHSRSCHA